MAARLVLLLLVAAAAASATAEDSHVITISGGMPSLEKAVAAHEFLVVEVRWRRRRRR